MILSITKSKNSANFYVQKSVRNGKKVDHITIMKLGNLEEVTKKANGQDPYVWARNFVDDLNKKEKEKNKEVLIPLSTGKLVEIDKKNSSDIGYFFLKNIFYSLGLNDICDSIYDKYSFKYDLTNILETLIYTRILYPSSKLSSNELAKNFLEKPNFELHDLYRSLDVLANESNFIQKEVYKNSHSVIKRNKQVLYYDCTNFFFEINEEDDFRKYGKSKENRPNPIVTMGLFTDGDGIPLSFGLFEGNKNEQPTLKPLEEKILKDFGLSDIVVCTDAGLSSNANRRFNDLKVYNRRLRSFITTHSIKSSKDYIQDFALSPKGWKIAGSDSVYDLSNFDFDNEDVRNRYMNTIFYKERIIIEDLSPSDIKKGIKPLEQRLIVSFSLKYLLYCRKVRDEQFKRAEELIKTRKYRKKYTNQNDPNRFIAVEKTTENGEICDTETAVLNLKRKIEEEKYDGFYAVCTNLDDIPINTILTINKRRWQIEECFRIFKNEFKARPVYVRTKESIEAHFLICFLALLIYRILENKLDNQFTCREIVDTLRNMALRIQKENIAYSPNYVRTKITDAIHRKFGFRTDYEAIEYSNLKKILKKIKKQKLEKK